MIAVIGSTLPASALSVHQQTFDNTLASLNQVGQPQVNVAGSGQQKTVLLAAGGLKGAEHTSNTRPWSKQKHQKGQATKQENQVKNPNFKNDKKKGSIQSKDTLEKLAKRKEAEKEKKAKTQNAESSKKPNARTR